jgi:hypothetical protein
VLHLSLPYQILHGAGHVLDRNIGIDAMLIEEIDPVGAEALERGVGHGSNSLGPTVEPLAGVALSKAKLGINRAVA